MAEPGPSDIETGAVRQASAGAHALADAMPRLVLEARRVAATVIHGLHGRRRAGSGENFWQYRRFVSGEPAQNVDWRRSARDDHLYVREREWEASHTIWLWPDRSPSMTFTSHLAKDSKLARGLVVAFALAEVLVQGGERVGIPGLMRPTASRSVIEKMAEAVLHDTGERPSLPPSFAPSPLAEIVVLSDLWSPIAEVRATIAQLSATGAHGHVVQIVDPAEESFPYSGRVEFVEPEGAGSVTAGRAETWRSDYQGLIARHRDAIRAETDQRGWTFAIHRTDRPATELLLALYARMGAHAAAGSARANTAQAGAQHNGLLALAFAQPLVLLGLLALPALWWLLRLVPPRPRRVDFPPTRLLFEIAPKEETPSRTPWWLILLRLLLAALVVFAAAGPLWNPPLAATDRSAPLLMLIDDGWAAAGTWDARMRAADETIARAEADDRGVALLPLSETTRDVSLQIAGAARVALKQVKPQPQSVDRAAALPVIERFLQKAPKVEVIWLSDGVDAGNGAAFVQGLKRVIGDHPLTIVTGGLPPAHALAAADNAAGALAVKVLRAQTGTAENGVVNAIDLKGLPLGDAPFAFKPGETETEAAIKLPVEIRNDVARLEIVGERSAGAVQLLDKRWRRRTVGIISGSDADRDQPLLGASYYLQRALNPFADVRLAEGVAPAEAVKRFLDQHLPMLILADVGNVAEETQPLTKWVEDGGVLVRFAGPHLAAGDDKLVPVKLRRGGRILGGTLSWDKPQPLAAYSRESPFAGLAVPNDVTVTRQVLAEPDAQLPSRTWATLGDGTPLVTAERRGKGLIVLFHVTADPRWSNLPLSGAFVDMLRHIVSLAGATPANTAEKDSAGASRVAAVAPTRVLDGFGAFTTPPPTAKPIPGNYTDRATAEHPPGFYGPPEGLIAVNTLAPSDRPAPLDVSSLDARIDVYRQGEPLDLRGPVFLAALGLLLLDALVVILLSGGIAAMRHRRHVTAALLLIGMLVGGAWQDAARAQTPTAPNWPPPLSQQQKDFALQATHQTHLAYIVTGDPDFDAVSKAGLEGLTLFLAQRTALEPGDPVGLDPAKDELAFFPLIYWPVSPKAPKPSQAALEKIDTYMKRGGTVLFDTRDAIDAPPGADGAMQTPGMVALRAILSSLDVPELEPVPPDHVLTKTFYLLRSFPGRFTDGKLWVEALPPENGDAADRPARAGDGVSSILITSNDMAGAWAMRQDGQAMLPLVPGEPRQREFAFRAGVNIVMYTLTGNYKADQVHVPALLERLGQ